MPVTFTRQSYTNNDCYYGTPTTLEVQTIFAPGTVLSVEPYTYHVPSDNAMIDSGNGRCVTAWHNGRVTIQYIGEGRPLGGFYTMKVDATPEVRELARQWLVWERWLAEVGLAIQQAERDNRELRKVSKGRQVEVIKGRKVKIGTRWWVAGTGNGAYGPYANLCETKVGVGEFIRYVSTDNLRVVVDQEIKPNYPPAPVPGRRPPPATGHRLADLQGPGQAPPPPADGRRGGGTGGRRLAPAPGRRGDDEADRSVTQSTPTGA